MKRIAMFLGIFTGCVLGRVYGAASDGVLPPGHVAVPEARSTGQIDWASARQHWAFRPVGSPPAPEVRDAGAWIQAPVDAFVLEKLREHGLQPSARADRRTLLRRASFDLIGLPPTPREVDEFLRDNSADAFAKVVDRLLDSPHYGERWGRHWLDIARYADTSGDRNNRGDPRYPYAWTYRDYVIQAFNRDLPFDQFIVEQIAADRLPERSDKSSLAALGFLTVGKRFMNNVNEILDDRIDVVTRGFLGLTVSCARCHDHKFDPIPTRDYYSLHGVFSSSVEPEEKPLLAEPNQTPDYKDYLKQLAAVEDEVKAFRRRELKRVLNALRAKADSYMMASLDLDPSSNDRATLASVARKHRVEANLLEFWEGNMRRLERNGHPVFAPWFAYAELPANDFKERAKALTREMASGHLSNVAANPVVVRAFRDAPPASLRDAASIYRSLFEQAEAARLAGLDGASSSTVSSSANEAESAGEPEDRDLLAISAIFHRDAELMRLDERVMRRLLGNQVQNRENQIRAKAVTLHLTHAGSPPRAMVLEDLARPRDSRVLVRGEPRNFGPSVPRQFLEVLSRENRAAFRDGSGRLELAKAIASRDNPLTARVIVSRVWQWHFGEGIVRTPSDFGLRSEPPTHPELLDYLATWFMDHGWSLKKLHRFIMLSAVYQQSAQPNEDAAAADPGNQWLWRMNVQRLDFEALRDTIVFLGGEMDFTIGGRPISPAQMVASPRRTLYGMVDRLALPETFRIFDFANPDMSSGQRFTTTVPQQALFLMNSPFLAGQARKLARRPEVVSEDRDEDRIETLFGIVYQRAPTSEEMRLALEFLSHQTDAKPITTTPAAERRTVLNEPRRARFDGTGRRKNGAAAPTRAVQPLSAWERYAQVLLLGNELIYVN